MDFEKELDDLRKKIDELNSLPSTASRKEEIAKFKSKLTRQTRAVFEKLTPWQKTLLARHPQRPYTLDYVELLIDGFQELHGDRHFSDDPALVTGLGFLGPHRVAIIGHQKGRDTKDKIRRNFGMAHPEGYRKALRIMKLAESFQIPILTLVDTPGAYPGIGAEERGQAEAIAVNILEMSRLRVPVIVTVTGEGGSGGALGIAVGDRVFMLEHSIYSVISPEGCASILWRAAEPKFVEEAAANLGLTAKHLLEMKLIDDILPEPLGGAHRDWQQMAATMKERWLAELDTLMAMDIDTLLKGRYDKFRAMGVYAGR
ncbi:MAG TPA: acetyl-CoA carboxylase carboxyltransferase subunit alpha [Thermoanaerobaculia bacterium]|nr:acetyl-CoA carboxylase carboxyltransferase subunit alpha [Thermoanaerobaculia bacterium]HUM29959.1 acetyl-CoA carboxylase carboxyltransferase subunit alpha [Thermoanaerobaculia bacterium]HXK68174.1 acetyl-CoA carboxylase carboxyltransferase subunit alpha [Thermoanaerobaculia bacterium]